MDSLSPWVARLEASWWQEGARPALTLRALSHVFGALTDTRRALFRLGWFSSISLPVPVIVVGNRTVGGAGKTPVALALLEALSASDWRPGVVSRGHGSARGDPRPVAPNSTAAEVGDEPLLMARRAGRPVWVGHDRAAAAQALLRAHPDVRVIVCDDGLQHLRLQRDLEVVVFDARGAGNGWQLPAGPLRESLQARTSARRQWTVYNAATPSTPLPGVVALRSLTGLVSLRDWWSASPNALRRFDVLQGQDVTAVAGIGAPQRFFDDLAAQGVRCRAIPVSDHDPFDRLPWHAAVPHVVVTEKDAVKLLPERVARERPATTVWVAPMAISLPADLLAELIGQMADLRQVAR